MMTSVGPVPAPTDDLDGARRVGPEWCRIGPEEAGRTGLVVEFAQATRVGAQRENNEDAVGCWRLGEGLLFAVADGVGGYDRGEVASRRALDALADTVGQAPVGWGAERRLRHGTEQANLAVHVPGEPPMATTLTATLLGPDRLTTVHVGDCRLLRLRDGELRQLTSDHNVAGRLASLGFLSPRGFRNHRGRRVVTRCLGQDPFVRIELIRSALRPGDVYIQCSDGIASLPGPEMIELLVRHEAAAAVACLVERTVALGGDDDISVQIATVVACEPDPDITRGSSLARVLRLLRGGPAP